MAAKKVVLNLQVHDEKEKQKALKAVSTLSGIESIAMDMKEKKLTVIGNVDAIEIVGKLTKPSFTEILTTGKLRKSSFTEILTIGPAKEEKKEGEKKDDKKDDGKKDAKSEKDQIAELLKLYREYNPYYTQHYRVYSAEENPNSCVIC